MTNKRPARKKVESPFAKNLKAILAERGISQTAAASIAGVSPPTVNDWLHASAAPNNLIAVQKLCRAMNCDFEWLLTGSQSKVDLKEIALTELFESEPDPSFSGIFQIEAKRLRVKKG
ncbi:MAG: helix-turn-helix transcriptional regulator [Bdellovibrionota bacterium]